MERKKPKALMDLNLLDRFLFNEVMEDPGTCQAVLEIILGRDVHLKENVQSEKEVRTLPAFRSIRMRCDQDPTLRLDDGAVRLFLYTRGKPVIEESEELQEFLQYVEHSDECTAGRFKSPRLLKLHERVLSVKSNEGIEVKYMQLWEEKIMDRQEARAEGIAEGLEKLSRLNLLLIEENRYDDLKRASKDREYREQLFKAFGL